MKDPTFYSKDPILFANADKAICRALGEMHKCAPAPSNDPNAVDEHRAHINKLVDIRSYLLNLAHRQPNG